MYPRIFAQSRFKKQNSLFHKTNPLSMTKYEALLQEFSDAAARLQEALDSPKSDIVRDSAIKRFEITFDLSWKMLKARLEDNGIMCTSPLNCFKESFQQHILEEEDIWVEMIKIRNKTVHTYDALLAEEVYQNLPRVLSAFQKLQKSLSR